MPRKGSDIQSLLSIEIVSVSTVGVYVVDGDVQKRVRYTEFVIQRDSLGINSRSVCGGWRCTEKGQIYRLCYPTR